MIGNRIGIVFLDLTGVLFCTELDLELVRDLLLDGVPVYLEHARVLFYGLVLSDFLLCNRVEVCYFNNLVPLLLKRLLQDIA
jgi:hypothetical protein